MPGSHSFDLDSMIVEFLQQKMFAKVVTTPETKTVNTPTPNLPVATRPKAHSPTTLPLFPKFLHDKLKKNGGKSWQSTKHRNVNISKSPRSR